ncbi:ABC transporter family substrate-binding protein [Corynebacterium sp. MSK195]|uniref:ABC transporter family substrate-binding protein n=1 Tax=Corynebacterium sp. MSK195 TaxID=3050216 RepID=UPI00254D1D99|nr:ABC transporter family substrate-binding protein [Corynebacterium sp. MSK195]MDK8669791.1 ABC transporter family substrate-binding protein [Corynebacterium sp. MSK195]
MKKFTRFRIATVATLSAAALALTGCAANSDGDSSKAVGGLDIEVNPAGDYNEKSRDELKDDGELTLALDELTEQQNMFHANMTADTRKVWGWYNPQLALYDGEGNYTPNPDYIDDVKEDKKGENTVVTFKVNKDATFNDGTPIDWKAFDNTWRFNNGKDEDVQVNATDGFERITSVEKGDTDKDVVVTFDGPYPWWQGLFNELLHPAIDSPEKFDKAYLGKLNPQYGAGPFKVDNVDFKGGTLTLVPNEKWWGDKPKLKKVSFRVMESQATINAFQAGEIDAAGVADKNSLTIAGEMGDAIDIRAALRPANVIFTLNSKAPQLKDEDVRHAVFSAIDRDQLAEIRYNGLGYEEEMPGSLTLYSTQEGYKDNIKDVIKFDPEQSKKLLEDAGYQQGDDGIYAKDGEKLSLRYILIGDDEVSKSLAAAVQKMLKDVGVDLKIEERPSSEFSKVTSERDFDLFLSAFASSDPFGVAYFGQTYASDSTLNMSSTGTKEFDKKIEELQNLPTKDEQIDRVNELESEAFGQYGILPFANGPQMVGVKKGLANYGANGFAILPKEDIGWEK